MKKFMLGMFVMLLFSVSSNLVWYYSADHDMSKLQKVSFYIKDSILEGGYLIDPFTGRCDDAIRTKEFSGAGRTNAEYFHCDKFQKFVNNKYYW